MTGLPSDYRAQGVFAASQLEFPDGQVLQSRQSGAILTGIGSSDHIQPLQGALGGVRVFPAFEPGRQPTTALLRVTDEELARYGSQPGRLTSALSIPLQHSRVIGALPLRERAVLIHDDMRVEVVRVERRHDGCSLVLRQWEVGSLLTVRQHRQHDYVLRNLARSEALIGEGGPGFAASAGLPLLYGVTLAQPQSQGFALHHFRVEYGRRWPGQAEQLRIDTPWLDQADLVIVETAIVGTITRSIAIQDFRMHGTEPVH